MRIKTINYSESHEAVSPMGLKRWRKLEMGADVDTDTEDIYQQSEKLKTTVRNSLMMDTESGTPITDQTTNTIEQSREPRSTISFLIEDIASCQDIKTLETYRIIAKSKPELENAYNQRMEELK